jgi:hypothetical protein
MTAADITIKGQQGTATCSFEKTGSRYVCTFTLGGATGTQTHTYPSLARFVDEAKAVGRVTHASVERVEGGKTATVTNSFDAQGRLEKQVAAPQNEVSTYTEWDTQGRPIKGTLDAPAKSCAGIAKTLTYDDAKRTLTETYDSTATQPPCPKGIAVYRFTYDADGNLVLREHDVGTPQYETYVFAPTASEMVCK